MTTAHLEIRDGYHNQVRADVVPSVPPSGGNLVDIGGGTGATAVHMKTVGRAGRCGIVDLVRAEVTDPGLDFAHYGDLEDSRFMAEVIDRDGPFDTILCLDVLEHLVDPWRLVEQLHRALAPNGVIVASIPNVRHYRVAGALLFRNRWNLDDAGILDRTHLRFFVRDTAVEMMTRSGLVLESVVSPLPMRRRRLVRLFRAVTFGRLDSLIAVDYVIRVRRPAGDGAA
jgi:2-polyprenyl-3-methyl-5-hydroxy-6-metoxy-1,4-benzoquinol methylase